VLRRLADQQQFSELCTQAQRYLDQTGDFQALPLLAMALTHLGQQGQAQELCAKIRSNLSALDLDARVDLAAVYCLLWQVESAAQLLEAALQTDPEHPLACARLAWCHMAQGRTDAARTLYQHAAALAPQRLPIWSALTQLHLHSADLSAAQLTLDQGVSQLQASGPAMPEQAVHQFTQQFRRLQLEVWVRQGDINCAEHWLADRRTSCTEDDWVELVGTYAALLAGNNQHAAAEDSLRNAITHYPSNITLMSQLAELAQVQGHHIQAIHLLRKAIRLSKAAGKPAVAFWARLSGLCLQHPDDRARKAASKALELANTLSNNTAPALTAQLQWQALCAMAQVENHDQHFEQAQDLYQQVLEQNPYHLPALQGLGQQHMQCGNFDAAVVLFERIQQIDPARGYTALISARQYPQDEQVLQAMEKAAHQPSLEGSLRSGLLLQLANAWEHRADFDKAFALATQANASSQQLLRYDPQAHRNRCARLRFAFSKAFFEHRPNSGLESTLPIYVLGMPRSGTSLVEQILAGHSRIFGAGELGLIPQQIQGLDRWERHTGSGRTYPDCMDDLSAQVAAAIAHGVLEELRELAAQEKPEASHVIDKLPHNFENIGFIKFLFPQARIISVRRDPRDIALSNFFTDYQAKHGGMGFAYDLRHIGEQLADHNLLMQHWHQLFPGEILEISYEDLLADPQATARTLLDYVGVPWEPQVLNFDQLERPVKTASLWQVRQPIYTTSQAKWRRYAKHLGLLIVGTNAKITWDPIQMVTLPQPGMLQDGVALYQEHKLDEAELLFKKLLHHLPEHAAANFMVGLIYAQKGHLKEAIVLMEKAYQKCPWNKHWRIDLIQAYTKLGDNTNATRLRQPRSATSHQTAVAKAESTRLKSEALR
jgi:tetratricopeptide (TPR) repeat protein